MDTFLIILIVGLVVGLIGNAILMWRNNVVYKARTSLLKSVGDCASLDINLGNQWEWRYDEFASVSYDDMIRKFWVKPLDMYDNLDFINPGIWRPYV